MNATLYKNKRTGQCVVDRAATYNVPFQLLTDQPNNAIAITANLQAGPYVMTVSKEGPLVVKKLSAQWTAGSGSPTINNALVRMMIQDGSGPGQMLMNAPCHINTIFGSGLQPYYLPQGLFLDENHAIEVYMSDLSGSTNTIRLNAGCSRARKPVMDLSGKMARERLLRRQYVSMPFFMTLDTSFVALTSGGTGNGIFSIPADFSFELHQISYISSGIFNVDIFNQATGEALVNAPNGVHYEVPNTLLLGSGSFPFRLHEPWLIGPGQKLIASLTDTSAGDNTVYITLAGVLFRTGGQR